MSAFEDIHSTAVIGIDRLIFRGHLTRLFAPGALGAMLWRLGVPLTGFGTWANKASTALCEDAQMMAAKAGRGTRIRRSGLPARTFRHRPGH